MANKPQISEKVINKLIVGVLFFISLLTVYPFVYTVSMSFSDPMHVLQNSIWLLPKGFSLVSYKLILENSDFWLSYYNTIICVVGGTSLSVFLTIISAYPLSRKKFFARNVILAFVVFTMFFNGGLIPLFILVRNLGLYNRLWAIVLPYAINTWNLIIAKTYLESIPDIDSLYESARIDGANDIKILFKMVLPISMPIIAVLILFYAVGYWNSYLPALIFLSKSNLQTLQLYLMKILVLQSLVGVANNTAWTARSAAAMQLKYSIIIVSILPILLVYPFLQKYFVKGIMIGAIKG